MHFPIVRVEGGRYTNRRVLGMPHFKVPFRDSLAATLEDAYQLVRESPETHFYFVESNTQIHPKFKFDYVVPWHQAQYSVLFRVETQNPLEDVSEEDMNGGVRLVCKDLFDGDGKLPSTFRFDREANAGFIRSEQHATILALDAYFLSADEGNRLDNFEQATKFMPGLTWFPATGSIPESHKDIAQTAESPMFFVLDADLWLTEPLVLPRKLAQLNLWTVKNPINGLVYGHGGPKLLSRNMFSNVALNPDEDMTASLDPDMNVIPVCVGEHRFNWSSKSTWRTAFRECYKLARSIKVKGNDKASEEITRLIHWTKVADQEQMYWRECLSGAWAGTNAAVNGFPINDYKALEEAYACTVI